jgi:hypothetical protein
MQIGGGKAGRKCVRRRRSAGVAQRAIMAPGWSMIYLICLTLVRLIVLHLLHRACRIMLLTHAATTHDAGMDKTYRQPGNQEEQQNSGKLVPHRSTTFILHTLTITAADFHLKVQTAYFTSDHHPGLARHSNC